MATLTYVQPDGSSLTAEVRNGFSVMEGAVNNEVEGIDADCRGACACATCHVYIDDAWTGRVGPANPLEQDLLEAVADSARPNSRLSCQIRVTDSLDGLVVYIPGPN